MFRHPLFGFGLQSALNDAPERKRKCYPSVRFRWTRVEYYALASSSYPIHTASTDEVEKWKTAAPSCMIHCCCIELVYRFSWKISTQIERTSLHANVFFRWLFGRCHKGTALSVEFGSFFFFCQGTIPKRYLKETGLEVYSCTSIG